MNNEQQILLEGATSDLVECVVRHEGVTMSEALDMVYKSRLYQKMENPLTGLYREGPIYLYDMLCEERGVKCLV